MGSVQPGGEPSCIDVRDHIHRQNTICAVAADTHLSSNPKGFLVVVRRRALLEADSGTAQLQ